MATLTDAAFARAVEAAARAFEPPRRRWATPGDLARVLDPSTVQTPALDLIDAELVALEAGQFDRLMILMPPQEGKSVRVSQRYPTWALERNPDLRFAVVSYADEMARRWGADIKQDVTMFDGTDGELDLGLDLRADSKAAGRWQIAGRRGGVYCVGVGGSLTGKPVDRLVIDDPLKDLEQAQSSRYRDRARRFWQGVAVPRLGPGARCVLIQTRWHEDDLAGWLLQQEPGRWRVLSIPAIAEAPDDPLGRPVGEPMVSARGQRDWGRIRESVGEYVWAALYQQRPAPAEGGLFKRAHLRYWRRLHDQRVDLAGLQIDLRDCWRFLTVDLAASTKTSADYTVAAVWGLAPDGQLLLLDGIRERLNPAGHWPQIRALWEQHAADAVYLEASQWGTTLVYEAGRNGMPILALNADTDKVTRALPATARADSGRLWLPQAEDRPWITDWVDELLAFPNAAHDDVVDATAYAARVAAAHWLPQEKAPVTDALREAARPDQVIENAYQAATGSSPNGGIHGDVW